MANTCVTYVESDSKELHRQLLKQTNSEGFLDYRTLLYIFGKECPPISEFSGVRVLSDEGKAEKNFTMESSWNPPLKVLSAFCAHHQVDCEGSYEEGGCAVYGCFEVDSDGGISDTDLTKGQYYATFCEVDQILEVLTEQIQEGEIDEEFFTGVEEVLAKSGEKEILMTLRTAKNLLRMQKDEEL